MADALSRFTIDGNQGTTQDSTTTKEIMSEINDIEEIPEDSFPINLKLIDRYQWKDPSLMAKCNKFIYKTGSFSWRK